MTKTTKELSRTMHAAQVCRAMGWDVGTRIKGNEGYGESVIEITAIGEKRLLAKMISHKGQPENHGESTWTLACRDWEPA